MKKNSIYNGLFYLTIYDIFLHNYIVLCYNIDENLELNPKEITNMSTLLFIIKISK